MCGIAGSVQPDAEGLAAAVETQIETLHHRGPDSSGIFHAGRGAIGQARLSIIDLVTGDPPITNEWGTIGATLNGEIYNHETLRAELQSGRHRFRTRCDTEVLAHLAEDREPADIARCLSGMFAFAIWDVSRLRLTLGRDRLGKKPLYYYAGGGGLVFASEIKGVLAHPGVPRALNPRAIEAYLTFGYVPTPETFYAGIYSVPAGTVLTFQPGGEPELTRYWSPPIRQASTADPRPFGSAAARLRTLLDVAVQRRLMSDVPVGAFLSGGVDSSAVVALMTQHSAGPVRTFTIGFDDDDGYDEREHAQSVATRLGTEHHEFVVKPQSVDLIETLVDHHDQPFGDSSAIPTYLLAEQTRQHVKVALSGDGGDEISAGYERFPAALALRRLRVVPRPVRRGLALATGALPRRGLRGRVGSAQRFLRADPSLPAGYRSWLAYLSVEQQVDLLLTPRSGWAEADYARVWAESDGAAPLTRLLLLNMQTYLLDDLLPKVDRMSMAHGLEVRSPLLDIDVVEYALGLPPAFHSRAFTRKRVLKEAVADLVPAEILARRKRGFGVPLDRWFRGELSAYVASMLQAPSARVRTHLDGPALDELVREHLVGWRDHGQAIWALLTLEVFLRREGW